MSRRKARPLPRLLLMTDERMGEGLWPAIRRLPRGAGIVFRHYRLPPAERRRVYERVRALARARRMPVLLAGPPREAVAWKADGVHGRSPHRAVRPLLRSAPAHHRAELLAARRAGADLILVSPIFPTRSHPGAPTLGAVKAGLMIGPDRRDIVALGGITHARGRAMQRMGIQRWAAIDGLAAKPPGDQKRKAVPI